MCLAKILWHELLLHPTEVKETNTQALQPVVPNLFHKAGCSDVSVEEVAKLVRDQHFF